MTQKIKSEVVQVYDTWLESYMSGDVATYDSYLDDAYHFIGSTNNEEFLSRKEATEFFRVTADQFAGKMQLKNETKTVEVQFEAPATEDQIVALMKEINYSPEGLISL